MAHPQLVLDPVDFDPASVSEETHALDAQLLDWTLRMPKWWEVGSAEWRRMRRAGETPRPAPVLLDTAESFSIPSREAGRAIPCRVLKPQNGKAVKGVFMHIHGGGWVIGDEESQDQRLQDMADDHGLVSISIGYRLAPEDPFPAGPEDCYDAAEWLVLHAEEEFGAPLALVGGDSAGGHLSMLSTLHLLNHADPRFAGFRFRGLLLYYGCFDLSWTPSAFNMDKTQPNLTLSPSQMVRFQGAFIPGNPPVERLRRPDVSPLYADLEPLRGRLPPALFVCGTKDCLLDDTLFMSAKWLAGGGETVVEIVPGAQHGFISFPRSVVASGSERGMAAVDRFIEARV